MSTVQEVETAILKVIRDYIFPHSRRLSELGLSYEISIARNSSESDGYRSEVLVEFDDENGPWDMLEFEVARRDQLVVSVEEIEKWLRGAFESVIVHRQEEAGNSREPNRLN